MNLSDDTMQQEAAARGTGRYQKRDAIQNPNLAIEEDDEDDGSPGFDELEMNFGGLPNQPQQTPSVPQGSGLPRVHEHYNYDTATRHEEDKEVVPGLWQSTVNSWKKQFGDVFYVDIKGEHFIFRSLERYEYKQILATPNTDPLIREEMICEYCVLYPADYIFATMSGQKAGYPAVLSEVIMDHSGFTRDVKVAKL
jgi:hypothetical protein